MFEPRARGDYWFRIGRFEFTSTMLVVLIGVVGMIASMAIGSLMVFVPSKVLAGEVWRLFTWPLANAISIWTVLTFLMLWYFGTSIEAELGRGRMMRLYAEIWAALTMAAFLIGVLLPGSTALAGLDQAEFVILLLWIAEYPTRRFFFNIPAWALGVFFVALNALSMLAAGNFGGIIAMFLGFLLVALAARRLGLLSAYPWLPGGRSGRSQQRQRPASGSKASGPTRQQRRHMSDEERMDDLLAKISAEGMGSLTKRERAELEQLRQRRQRR